MATADSATCTALTRAICNKRTKFEVSQTKGLRVMRLRVMHTDTQRDRQMFLAFIERVRYCPPLKKVCNCIYVGFLLQMCKWLCSVKNSEFCSLQIADKKNNNTKKNVKKFPTFIL